MSRSGRLKTRVQGSTGGVWPERSRKYVRNVALYPQSNGSLWRVLRLVVRLAFLEDHSGSTVESGLLGGGGRKCVAAVSSFLLVSRSEGW